MACTVYHRKPCVFRTPFAILTFAEARTTLQVWPRALSAKADRFRAETHYAYDLTEGDRFLVDLPSLRRESRKLYTLPESGAILSDPPLVLEYLEMRNFRCFNNLLVPFDQHSALPGKWTCVVGLNGAGKSSVLEALCLALLGQPVIRELGGERLDRMRRKEGSKTYDAELRLWLREGRDRRYVELRIGETGRHGSDAVRDQPAAILDFWRSMRSKLRVAYGATRNLSAYLDTRNDHLSPELRRLMTVFDPLTQLASANVLLESGRGNRSVKQLLASLVERVFRDDLVPVMHRGRLVFRVENEPLEAIDLPDGFRSSLAWMADSARLGSKSFPTRPKVAIPQGLKVSS